MNDTIPTQTTSLDEMRLPDLQARYAAVFGEATKCPNRKWLIRKLQEAEAQEAVEDDTVNDGTQPIEPEPVIEASPDQRDQDPPGEPTPDSDQPAPAPKVRLTKLSVPELRAMYAELLGKETQSQSKPYLVYKLRQTQNGKLPARVTKDRTTTAEPREFKILPLRMDAELVARLDEARERLGLRSRMELFRRALGMYLANVGEGEVAGMMSRHDD